jgi:hypothetical protein
MAREPLIAEGATCPTLTLGVASDGIVIGTRFAWTTMTGDQG